MFFRLLIKISEKKHFTALVLVSQTKGERQKFFHKLDEVKNHKHLKTFFFFLFLSFSTSESGKEEGEERKSRKFKYLYLKQYENSTF